MSNDNKLNGVKKEYPISIYKDKKEFIINNDDELIKLIEETTEELKAAETKDNKIELKHVLNKLDISIKEEINPIQIADRRTLQILDEYEIYKNAPYLINNVVWRDSVKILNKLQPKLF